jgi:hypothetical protein
VISAVAPAIESASGTNASLLIPAAFNGDRLATMPVSLTFHLWSGKTLTYTVTRDGTAVTGVA